VINPPELRFRDACNEHDLAYAFGGPPGDRKAADREFRREMLLKAEAERLRVRRAPWKEKPLRAAKATGLWLSAWGYYGAVRVFGWRYWGKG
jgi:hypothetical protein